MTQLDAIVCPACHHRQIVGVSEKVVLLRKSGKLRRSSEPDPALIDALLEATLGSAGCGQCGHHGLQLQAVFDESEDPEVWGEARRCAGCGRAISPERLEVFPDARRCAACEQAHQSGANEAEEYCPRCGGRMALQSTSGAGLTRYRSRCASCGYRG